MRKELDELLCEKYPRIFKDRHAPMTHTAMCWGFDCGDGWFNIIDSLCSNIQNHIDRRRKARIDTMRFNRALRKAIDGDDSDLLKHFRLTEGKVSDWWKNHIEELIKLKEYKEVPPPMRQVVASQVKEKFGGLRFYVNSADDAVYALINMAESMSVRTCEVCGSPGKQNSGGWIKTLCETHRNERENRHA